ncbi:MAG: hypothetical protein IIZ94_07245 [Prevotella sp.]|nr:hypothetical protein [Prevotella sp.]
MPIEEVTKILFDIVGLVDKYGPSVYDAIRELIIANKDPKGLTVEAINSIFKNQVTPAFQQLNEDC